MGDSNFRLKTIQHGAAGTGNAFPHFTYEYDKVSNISKLTTLSTAGTDTQTFTYDDLDRLLTAGATGGVANYSQTYAYSQIGNITSFAGTAYTYSGGKPHAVTHLGGVQKFWYDANGNMTSRIEGSTTYTQVFDVENRLTSVTPSGGSATTFAYDANGIRTKTVQPGGITTYFPFPGYEETVNGANTIKRSTYSFAGQTVAMRVSGDPVSGNNGLFYVLSDHLGSTSMLVNSSGSVVAGSTTRNLPFGGYRGTAPSQSITDRDFTGQKENMELGLLYYQARFYVPGIGRFLSADTIVPNPASPQSFNRYSYVRNSPLNFIDPSGHVDCALLGDSSDIQGCQNQAPSSLPSQPPSTPTPIFEGLPVASENITWANGFGANSYADKYGNPDSEFYNPNASKYVNSAGIHPGLDFDADAGAIVNSNVHGNILIESNPYPRDAAPNVVILIVPNQNGQCGICVVFSHVNIKEGFLDGQQVSPGEQIGTVVDQGTNSHVHLSLREGTQVVHNPINYFTDPIVLEGIPWSGYAEGENLYSISSYKLPPGDALYNFWTDGEAAAGVIRP